MKKQLSKLRRFFARTGARKLDATATREAIPMSYDDDDGSTRLSGAFIIVLLLHVVALVGVFTYSRMRENSASTATQPTLPALPPKPSKATPPPTTPKAPVIAQTTPPPVEPIRAADPDLPPLPTPPPAVKVEGKHVVKPGENLTRIALLHSVSKNDIAAANGIKNENELREGQVLTIPTAKVAKPDVKSPAQQKPPKTANGYYTVRKNDTLAKIANNLGVKYEDLSKANSIKDPKRLQEGQKLKVPSK